MSFEDRVVKVSYTEKKLSVEKIPQVSIGMPEYNEE
jgi:hypothetical protein